MQLWRFHLEHLRQTHIYNDILLLPHCQSYPGYLLLHTFDHINVWMQGSGTAREKIPPTPKRIYRVANKNPIHQEWKWRGLMNKSPEVGPTKATLPEIVHHRAHTHTIAVHGVIPSTAKIAACSAHLSKARTMVPFKLVEPLWLHWRRNTAMRV